jgi:UDP-3-O-[3-hydroxymyristoyl] glucosamine N-acyltransferase
MQFTAAQIALLVNGKIEGDPGATVSSFGKIETAKEGQLSFLVSPKYEEYIYNSSAGILLVNENLEIKKQVKPTLVRVKDAYSALAILLTKYQEYTKPQPTGIQEPAYIAKTAQIGEHVYIGAFSYIGEHVIIGNHTKIYPGSYIGNNASIGEHCRFGPGVKIYHDCKVGHHVNIMAGAVIGADGFGFAPQPDGSFMKIPQIGNVVIGDHVEIGANVTIDRGTLGSTIIHPGVKMDNLVHVAHNVEIGSDSVVAAQVGVSGSTTMGRNVMIGGQAGLVGHIHIGDGAKVNAQSGVSKSMEPGKVVTGSPAYDYTAALRAQAIARNLPDIQKRLNELETLVKQLLEEKLSQSDSA